MTSGEFNAFCGALPATSHVVQWSRSHVWKVGGPTGKVFAFGSWERGAHSGITFKVSEIAWEVLRQAEGCRPAPYMASRGLKWIQVFDKGVSDRELKKHLAASYELAAKTLTRAARREWGLE